MRTFFNKNNQSQPQESLSLTRPYTNATRHEKTDVSRTVPDVITINGFAHDFSRIPISTNVPATVQAKLAVSAQGDTYEQEADLVAKKVMRLPEPQKLGACACSEGCARCQTKQQGQDHKRVQAKRTGSSSLGEIAAPPIVREVLASPGQPISPAIRTFMEPRFGHDFSHVRVHTDARAVESANAVGAQAYTVGQHIAFGSGQYRPHLMEGRQLLAHELTHVVQQSGGAQLIQRSPKDKDTVEPEKDPLCDTFDLEATKGLISTQAGAFKAEPHIAQRQALIRTLKLIRRCATPEQQEQIRTDVAATVGEKEAEAIWDESGTAFGGYTGMYPGYAPDMKQTLKKLGVKESVPFNSFHLPFKEQTVEGRPGLTPAQVIKEHRARSKKAAAAEVPDLARTDIIYFRGHQYAQYTAPGVFADFKEEFGFDLRYIEKAGGFPNVKLMISTSCATLCKEALDVFLSLFPNAVILGFRKSDPKEGGAPLRDAFQSKIQALNRPLLLDQAVDVGAIISAWKSVAQTVKGDMGHILPGYYDGSLNYWDGKAWQSIDPNSAENKCTVKKDARNLLPGPAAPK